MVKREEEPEERQRRMTSFFLSFSYSKRDRGSLFGNKSGDKWARRGGIYIRDSGLFFFFFFLFLSFSPCYFSLPLYIKILKKKRAGLYLV